jgi:hypothetical protein
VTKKNMNITTTDASGFELTLDGEFEKGVFKKGQLSEEPACIPR